MWKNAKDITKNKYPGLYENSPEFIEKALTNYVSLTKVGSIDEILDELNKENIISKTGKLEFNKYKSEVDILKKTAISPGFQKALGVIGNTALGTGAALLVAGGASLAGDGINALQNRLMRKSRLEKIYKYNPHLRNVDQDRLQQTISDMEDLNPGISKSPIVMGTLLADAMTEDGIHLDKAKGIKDLRSDSIFDKMEVKPMEMKYFKTKDDKEPKFWKNYKSKRDKDAFKFNLKKYEKDNNPKLEHEYEKNSSANNIISASNFF